MFISRRIEENLNLEYTSIKSLDSPSELKKEIAAFANSDGGLLFIGISEEIKGQKRLPIEIEWNTNVKRTREWFQDITINQIWPLIPGIRIIPVQSEKGNIFLVDIPASQTPPHMSDGKYYHRNNFESNPMEHYQVADAFGKRRRPVLKPIVKISNYDPKNRTLKLSYGLTNFGQVLAKWPMLHIILSFCSIENEHGLDFWQNIRKEKTEYGEDEWIIHWQSPISVLHAGMQTTKANLNIRLVKSPAILRIIVAAEEARTDYFITLIGERWLNKMANQTKIESEWEVPILPTGEHFQFDNFEWWEREFADEFKNISQDDMLKYGQIILGHLRVDPMQFIEEFKKMMEKIETTEKEG